MMKKLLKAELLSGNKHHSNSPSLLKDLKNKQVIIDKAYYSKINTMLRKNYCNFFITPKLNNIDKSKFILKHIKREIA